jgi:hypothetical protein
MGDAPPVRHRRGETPTAATRAVSRLSVTGRAPCGVLDETGRERAAGSRRDSFDRMNHSCRTRKSSPGGEPLHSHFETAAASSLTVHFGWAPSYRCNGSRSAFSMECRADDGGNCPGLRRCFADAFIRRDVAMEQGPTTRIANTIFTRHQVPKAQNGRYALCGYCE